MTPALKALCEMRSQTEALAASSKEIGGAYTSYYETVLAAIDALAPVASGEKVIVPVEKP